MDKLLNKPPISVEDVPLVPYLQRVRKEEIAGEIRNIVLLEELGEKAICRKRISPTVVRRRRALSRSPVKRLDDEQIREEYGIMSRPYPEYVQNVLWVLKTKPGVTPKEAADILEADRPIYTGQVMRKLYQVMRFNGRLLISRMQEKKTHRYKLTPHGQQLTVEGLYEAYKTKTIPTRAKFQDLSAPLVEEPALIEEEKEQDLDLRPGRIGDPVTPVIATEALLEEAVNQNKGLTLTVTGKIEVVFKFER